MSIIRRTNAAKAKKNRYQTDSAKEYSHIIFGNNSMSTQKQTASSVWSLSNLFKSKLLADVHFEVKSKFGKTECVSAHKNVLASISRIFERMFRCELEDDDIIPIDETNAVAFNEFLQLFYIENVSFTETNIADVLRLIQKYDVPKFIEVIDKYLLRTINKDNVFLYYELSLSHKLSLQLLLEKSEQILCISPEVMFQSPRFLSLKRNILMKVLDLDGLQCDEMAVFDAAVAWARKSLAKQGTELTDKSLRDELQDVIYCIRFPIMGAQRFVSIVERYPNLFDTHTYLDIMAYIASKRALTRAKKFKIKHRFISKNKYEAWKSIEAVECPPIHRTDAVDRYANYLSCFRSMSTIDFAVSRALTEDTVNNNQTNESVLLSGFDVILPLTVNNGLDLTIYECRVAIDDEESECETTFRSVRGGSLYLDLTCKLKSPIEIVCSKVTKKLVSEVITNGTFRLPHSPLVRQSGISSEDGLNFTSRGMKNNKFITKLYFSRHD